MEVGVKREKGWECCWEEEEEEEEEERVRARKLLRRTFFQVRS